ncbi:hypothetical protein SEA_SKOG_135 [Gordonia phage Skog]|uniref:Uncharacterized protein n=1 Tax=Gordonia phage Skog TaxID=2704033 RepID=A0A6G6XJP6_9CAUD|nr:hypothetical protein KHQ85_gp135 [Gordonia phage Skog]QIG58287.1 hypothetical protein SEA_SKOG_135 [Gordonia phage Skog]
MSVTDGPNTNRDVWVTPEGNLVVRRDELGNVFGKEVYLEGRFQHSADLYFFTQHGEVDESWFKLSELLETVQQKIEGSDVAYRKGYVAGQRFEQHKEERPSDNGEPLLWRDRHMLVVRNNDCHGYSHLEFQKAATGVFQWVWAANLDQLPHGAQPLYDPAKVELGSLLPEVEVYRGPKAMEPDDDPDVVNDWFADLSEVGEVNVTLSYSLGKGGDRLDKAIADASQQLATLLAIQRAERAERAGKIEGIADWILSTVDEYGNTVDLSVDSARDIAEMMIERYDMTPRGSA